MRIAIFDVSNGDCSLLVCPNGHGLMIDCGSNSEKICPVDIIEENLFGINDWSGFSHYGDGYKLTLLHITHPDYDHIKNAEKVVQRLKPKLLHKRDYDVDFPSHIQTEIDEGYKKNVCKAYRNKNHATEPNWGFNFNKPYQIPMTEVLNNELLSGSPKNNSSILRIVEYAGRRILFGGDIETNGWQWLLENNQEFKNKVENGVDVFLAPHHGHKSGFSGKLFEIMGRPHTILSKGSEAEKEGSDVSGQYSALSTKIKYAPLNKEESEANILTTRKNGHIFIDINEYGEISFITEK